MQRTNIEFERQRHLANWLVKSSPHMAAAAAAGAAPPTAGVATGAAAAVGAAVAGGGSVAAAVQGAPSNSATVACNGKCCNGGRFFSVWALKRFTHTYIHDVHQCE